ncbi:heavy-metal-associated domain-containing protein [Kitasatospora cathayae]|uniref:Heavy-metal-associated domain-containing protein n=1 Tax=Kitasatospora cathayae TaxID=3004092 RepID=A0ABY7PXL7_9ACTN|nr:heavy-metal-associated domain-containing protein [Kitasatospora sp. HUAS 3-15]WBP85100.1 heavy-metal-associated domain-containing protein [Kitasatospora sp. HUAS 3-15]
MTENTITVEPTPSETAGSSCCGSCGTGAAATAAESANRAVFQVTGMTCGHCVNSVTAELKKIDGVADVAVDLATGRVTVDSAQPLDDSAVAAAIDEAGYELAGRLSD